jgi:hypothetical protein
MTTAIPVQTVYSRPESLTNIATHYCPGCTHGVAHRLIAEVLDDMGLREKTIGVAPVGCSVFAYNYFDCDFVEAAHGRAPAMATGIKRVLPEKIVFTYQGDGDLASIGMGEIMHVAARGENITVIFINNAIYGMTGGQMAPTSLPGQKTTSSPRFIWRRRFPPWKAPAILYAAACTIPRMYAWQKRPFARLLKCSSGAWGSLWSNYSPVALPTGAFLRLNHCVLSKIKWCPFSRWVTIR